MRKMTKKRLLLLAGAGELSRVVSFLLNMTKKRLLLLAGAGEL